MSSYFGKPDYVHGADMAEGRRRATDDPGELLTVRDLAELLRTTPATIHHWRQKAPGKMPPGVRIGRKLLFRRDDVDAWLETLPRG